MISRDGRRHWVNRIMLGLTMAAAVISMLPLFLIFFHILSHGLGSINWDFFTRMPQPVGETGGGFANAIVGSLILLVLACAFGLPIGIFGGIYLSEYGGRKVAGVVRFASDLLNGTPSIVVGMFAYTIMVRPMRHFSALAGGVALGIIMIPTILSTTETMMRMVPRALREGALALGLPYWKTLVYVVLKAARGGILTGVLLAIARIAGETAPLLFTALGNQFWSTDIRQPIAALPLQIFTYAISPYDDWHNQAWAGATILIGLVLMLSIVSRLFIRNRLAGKRS
ncbi:MAG TPA: phosphate ABC transporter permease PstA [bacterium]|nr:phosphate ABC transporter permease PstA [bacterium]